MADEFKTEQPTPHRIAEARKKGNVFKSQELNFAITVLAIIVLLDATSRTICFSMKNLVSTTITNWNIVKFGAVATMNHYLIMGFKIIAPALLLVFVAGILLNILQVGFLFSTHPLSPNWSKLNPIEGFKRIYSRRAIFELVKNFIKILLTFLLAISFIKKHLASFTLLFYQKPAVALFSILNHVFALGKNIALLFLMLAILDYLYQRYEYYERLKMTKQEVKEEYKQLEGDPFLKQRQHTLRVKAMKTRMMEAVKKARVVITNPTHIACALKYDDDMDTPQLVAKGRNFVAENIVKVAKENKVHIIENKPVAWALFNEVDIDDHIPPKLFHAVAEIVYFVMQLEKHETVDTQGRV